MYLKAYIQNLIKNGHVVTEKSKVSFLYVNDLGLRSRNDLDYSISVCIYEFSGHRLQLFLNNSLLFYFIVKVTKSDLAVK